MEGKRTFKSQQETLLAQVTSAKAPKAVEVCVLEKDKFVRQEELYEMKTEIKETKS